ncbi:MAG TPA: hypothetical protein DDZ40_13535 [Deltaproteobacteria bacterium]|nr:hypothetical protein [Deltaproteobacteria bacterium]
MNRIRANKLALLLASFVAFGGIILCAVFIPRQGVCYVRCSPVIGVTNYSYFSALLKNLTQDRLITELKLCLSEKLNLEFTPGNFKGLEAGLRKATDLSLISGDLVNTGLNSQLNYARSGMSVEAFTNRLNRAVLTALRQELRQGGFEEKQAGRVLADYGREFLNSRQTVGIYANQVKDLQAMAAEFLPSSTKLLSRMAVLAGKMDVADGIQGKQGAGTNGNTRQILEECLAHTKGGLKNIAGIAGIAIADSISGEFRSVGGDYLKARLAKLRTLEGNAALSDKDIGKIIESVDKAAAGTVSDHIRAATGTLADLALQTNISLTRKIKDGVASALSAIDKATVLEKEKERAADRLYAGLEKEVYGLLRDSRQFGTVAREKNGASLLDKESVKEITVLLTGRNSSLLRRKLAVKHYIAARASLETASAIRIGLSGFDPGAIDGNYEDMAWKDLARFHYYLLCLENQRLRLLALRAMTESLGTEDPDVVRYAEDSGLPEGF